MSLGLQILSASWTTLARGESDQACSSCRHFPLFLGEVLVVEEFGHQP
jgi:hypothetical protein